MKKMNKRNNLIDAIKVLAALGVIFVHFPFPGIFGKICAAFGTVGVVFFFLISGYQTYCEDASESNKILRRFKRNLILVAVVILIYVLYTVIKQIVLGTITVWMETYLLNPITYVRLFILGDLDFINCGHLWFMVAILYGYLIIYCMEKFRLHKWFYIALPILLLLRISMETYTNSFSHFVWFDWHFSGNFLVGALPIMVLGNYICCNEDKILKLDKRISLICAIILMLLVFVTVNIKILNMDCSQLFKISAATMFFIYALAVPLKEPVPLLSNIGRNLSMHIYIWHNLVGLLIKDLLTYADVDKWAFDWVLPVVTIFVTILISFLLYKLLYYIKSQKQNEYNLN